MRPSSRFALAACFLWPLAAGAQPADHPLKAGDDVCFARAYDAKHHAAHPKQIVRSIALMSRNAWRGGPSPGLYASVVVRFRDTPKPLVMHGRCLRPDDGAPNHGLRCKFFLETLQDVLTQAPTLEWPDASMLRFTASGDWTAIRRAKEPDGEYGAVTTDDKVFTLERKPVSACTFPKGFWTASGPTERLIGLLP